MTGAGEIVSCLLALEAEKATGVLDFRAEGVATRIFLDAGTPIFAESGVLGETLGHVLVRERIITAEQLAAVVRKMTDAIVENEHVRFGEVIVELGILDKEQLEDALFTQVEKKVIGCVPRGKGEFTFEPSRDRVAEVSRFPVPVRTVLVPAAKLLSQERIEDLLELRHERFPRVAHEIATLAADFALDDLEIAALNLFDGTRSTKSILASSPAGMDLVSLLAALVLGRGVILDQKMDTAPKSAPGKPVTATGKRRALRQALDESAKNKAKAALDRLLKARDAPAPAPKSQRQATIFAEDEFQTGRRLLLQGNVVQARAKFEKAVELSPAIALYALHAQFAASRGPTGFADHEATKKLATRLVREDAECAFGYYVLAYLALEQHAAASAKKLFRRAHEIDPELIDAARQVRLLDIRADAEAPSVATPYHAIVPTLLRSGAPDGAPGGKRIAFLAVAIVVVLLVAALAVVVTR